MKRSVGVTVIAMLSLLGSILTFLMGVLMVVVMAFAPPQHEQFPVSPAVFKLILVLAAMVYILPAVWGIITSVGLFRLSNWARISLIVFSVLLILMGGFSGLMSMFLPFAPSTSPSSTPGLMSSIRIAMVLFWVTLFAIGTWWLIFFTRPRVKQQFGVLSVAPGPPTMHVLGGGQTQNLAVPYTQSRPQRPLSFTIIAWLLLVGSFFMPVNLIIHFPAILFTKLLTGWTAVLYYLVMAAMSLYVGIGLLRFKPFARGFGVVYYLFFLVNTGVFYLAPGGRGRMRALLDAQSTIFPWMQFWQNQPELQLDQNRGLFFGGLMGVIFLVIPVYFLITRKQAFEAAAAIRQSSGSPQSSSE